MAMMQPGFITPAELARNMGCSERTLRAMARRLGACRVIGKTMVLTDDDVKAVLEAARPCPSASTNEAKSGTSEVRLPEGDYEALRALRTRQQRSASPPSAKRAPGKVVLMARKRS